MPIGSARQERHDERPGGGEAGRDEHGVAIHARRGQDLRVDEHDVGYRQKTW